MKYSIAVLDQCDFEAIVRSITKGLVWLLLTMEFHWNKVRKISAGKMKRKENKKCDERKRGQVYQPPKLEV
jgi:hypothetical protein